MIGGSGGGAPILGRSARSTRGASKWEDVCIRGEEWAQVQRSSCAGGSGARALQEASAAERTAEEQRTLPFVLRCLPSCCKLDTEFSTALKQSTATATTSTTATTKQQHPASTATPLTIHLLNPIDLIIALGQR